MHSRVLLWLAVFVVLASGRIALADEGCTALKWNVAHERFLFNGLAKPVVAAKHAKSASELRPDELYELTLVSQGQITPAAPPGKKSPVSGAFAGLAPLHTGIPGRYWISLARAGWIDVLDQHGAPIAPSDYTGGGRDAPQKVVQFELPAADLVMQISSVGASQIQLTVTRTP